jgi:hypothetical protein
MFELSFHDDRYLPFEGAGAVSSWRLELPDDFRQFDYSSIADVVVHVRYTAREGGQALATKVNDHLVEALNALEVQRGRAGLFRLLSLKTDLADAWYGFVNGVGEDGVPAFEIDLSASRFPTLTQRRTVTIERVSLLLRPADGVAYAMDDAVTLEVTPPGEDAVALDVQALPGDPLAEPPGAVALAGGVVAAKDPDDARWRFRLQAAPAELLRQVPGPDGEADVLDPAKVDEVLVLVKYALS